MNSPTHEDLLKVINILKDISEWNLPETGSFWDEDKTRPISYYEYEYGSQGAKMYIRNLAIKALRLL